jgi:dGTPase
VDESTQTPVVFKSKGRINQYGYDEDVLFRISEITGTKNDVDGICRHPLTYVLEAANDIAYSAADLEDAFKKST